MKWIILLLMATIFSCLPTTYETDPTGNLEPGIDKGTNVPLLYYKYNFKGDPEHNDTWDALKDAIDKL